MNIVKQIITGILLLVAIGTPCLAQEPEPPQQSDSESEQAQSPQVQFSPGREPSPEEAKKIAENAANKTIPVDTGTVDDMFRGDIAWMLVSIAFVLMMTTPGLALFYGGLVRKKNILSVMMQCVFLMGLMSMVWAVVGYSLAFAPPMIAGFDIIGGLDHLNLAGVSPWEDNASEFASEMITVAFQGMFFIITPALICGAFAERMKFSTMVIFSVLWGLFVYCPIAHWVWSGTGWLSEFNSEAYTKLGAGDPPSGYFMAIDFAGGLVVHISSGVSALVMAILIGKRKGFPVEPMPPHNLTYTVIGTGLLWVGWFGFNGGSAAAADGRAITAVLSTHLAASAGVVAWSLAEMLKHKKASILGACSGAVAGLVCITPAAGSVHPIFGMAMGLIAGGVCFFACTTLKSTLGYDDSLDAFGIHGVGGILGALLTGVFANHLITGSDVTAGAFDGNPGQLVNQVVSVVAAVSFSLIMTLIIGMALKVTIGLRVSEEDEVNGLDVSQHGEDGYIFQ